MLITVKGLVDVDRKIVVDNAWVMTEQTQIVNRGRQTDMPAVNDRSKLIEYTDQYLLPGLINSHAHLVLPSAGKPFHYRQSDEMALLTAVRNMQIEHRSGVTTLRDCGDQNGVLFSLRQAIEEDILTGPRLLLCGPPLTCTGGHAHFLGGQSDGPESIRTAVEERIDAGADFIKLIATGGSTPGTRPALASYSVAEMAMAVKTAHRSGKPVAAHCRGIPGIRNAIDAGVDHIEHACFELPDGSLRFDRDLAERMSRAGTFVTPTIQLYRDARDVLNKKQASGGLTPEESERLKRSPKVIAEKYRSLQELIKLGVKCVAGSDAGLPQTGFGRLWQELDAMICAGMTPMQAILSATRTAAEAMNMADSIGSVRVGKQADLLVVEENPVEDIRALKKVRMVMKAGQIVYTDSF